MTVTNWKETRFRNDNASETAEVVEAVINTTNEALAAFEDGKLSFGEVAGAILDEMGGWFAAGKGIGQVDDEIKTLGVAKVADYLERDINEGLSFPPKFAAVESKVDAVLAFAKAGVNFYLALATK